MVRKAAVAIVIATLAAQTVTAVPLLGRQVSTKVVGGVEAQEREFPYIVSLAKGGSHFCGGTLLDANTVLTASHCLEKERNPSAITVRAGSLGQSPSGQGQSPSGQGQSPSGQGQFPSEQGQFPSGQGQSPSGQGQFPSGQGQSPSGQGQFPSGQGQSPSGQGQFPSGQGQSPSGQGQFPSGQGQFPSGQGQFPSGQGQFPSGQGQFPSGQGQFPSGPGNPDPVEDPFAGDQVDLSQLGAGGGDTTIFPANLVATLNEIKGKIATVPSFLKGTNNIQASVAATTTKRVPTTERPTRALHERGGQAAAPPSIGGPVAAARRRPPGSRTDVWQSLARVAAAPLGAPRARQVDAQVERLPVVLLGGVPDHVHHQDLAPRAACQCHDAPGGGTPTAHTKQQPGATLAKWSGR
ncbi:trypsin domain-containing protein [Cordyceps javanica]|nr:trypsin domain-containing protein [Cordyceps javanica]